MTMTLTAYRSNSKQYPVAKIEETNVSLPGTVKTYALFYHCLLIKQPMYISYAYRS